MFFLTIEASPKPEHSAYGKDDGAVVSCWVNEPTAQLAESAARAAIEGHGWDALELDSSSQVSREELAASPEKVKLFDQARVDGFVITFHTWSVGADDA